LPGFEKRGALVVVRNEVELKVTAGDIPDNLEVDLAETEIGDTIHMSDITLPEGTRTMITDRDFVIANIAAPKAIEVEEVDEVVDGAETETGEGEADASEENTEA